MSDQLKRIVRADRSLAPQVEALRYESYINSVNFEIVDLKAFEDYYCWGEKDESGTVLLALNEKNEAISTLRGNIYYSQEEIAAQNINFRQNADGFLSFPVLDMTFAATSPRVGQNGFLSALRYHMYAIHRDKVSCITGVTVSGSSIHKTLEMFGYDFREIVGNRKELQAKEKWLIACLDIAQIDPALSYLKTKYADILADYPLT